MPGPSPSAPDQRGPHIPERAAEDDAGGVDLADVVGPDPLADRLVEVTQRLVVEEEAAAHAVIAGDDRGQEIGGALAHRAVEQADTVDDREVVQAVAELVIDDVGDPAGVLAAVRGLEEVDGAVGVEGVALVGDVDQRREGAVDEGQGVGVGDHAPRVGLDDLGVHEGRQLGVEQAVAGLGPAHRAVGADAEVGGDLGRVLAVAGLGADLDQLADHAGDQRHRWLRVQLSTPSLAVVAVPPSTVTWARAAG